MATESRSVPAGRGWVWIVEGFALFRKSPAVWVLLLLVLLALAKLPVAVFVRLNAPTLAILFLLLGVLLMPVFMAGLMEGCRALEHGRPLAPGYLLSGFYRNTTQLVAIGGAWVVANLVIANVVSSVGGEAMMTMINMVSQKQQIEPQAMREAQQVVGRAAMLGVIISIPWLMAACYAPLLVYFHNESPLSAMRSSFVACLKNAGSLLLYGLLIVLGMFLAMPFGMALGQYDLALWLVAPIVLPSLYASYKDIFLAGIDPQPETDSVAG